MTPTDEPQSLRAGRYTLRDPLGSGGVSTVFRARDHEADVDCAVKLLLSHAATNPRARARFVQEAHATAWLRHPNVVQVHDIGDGPAPYFYVMELASGSLAQQVRETGPCGSACALGFAFQVLRALDHAHAAGVVHRDVKPQNMLLTGPEG